MITSYINKQFYTDSKEAINEAVSARGIGNVSVTDLGTMFRVRGLDAREIANAVVYLLLDRGNIGDRKEDDDEYRASVSGELMSAMARVENNVFDAVVFEAENANHIMCHINGWPKLAEPI